MGAIEQGSFSKPNFCVLFLTKKEHKPNKTFWLYSDPLVFSKFSLPNRVVMPGFKGVAVEGIYRINLKKVKLYRTENYIMDI